MGPVIHVAVGGGRTVRSEALLAAEERAGHAETAGGLSCQRALFRHPTLLAGRLCSGDTGRERPVCAPCVAGWLTAPPSLPERLLSSARAPWAPPYPLRLSSPSLASKAPTTPLHLRDPLLCLPHTVHLPATRANERTSESNVRLALRALERPGLFPAAVAAHAPRRGGLRRAVWLGRRRRRDRGAERVRSGGLRVGHCPG